MTTDFKFFVNRGKIIELYEAFVRDQLQLKHSLGTSSN